MKLINKIRTLYYDILLDSLDKNNEDYDTWQLHYWVKYDRCKRLSTAAVLKD